MKDSILESEHSIKEAIKTFKEKGLEELSKKESEILLSLMDTEYQNNHSPRGPYPKYEGKGYKGYPTFLDRGTNTAGTEHVLVEVVKLDTGKFVDLNEVPEVKINEEYRNLLPELAENLEKYGLKQYVLIDNSGFTHDGEKRLLLLGSDQIKALGKLGIVSEDSEFFSTSLTSVSNKAKEVIIKDLYTQYTKKFPNGNFCHDNASFVKMIIKRYGLSKTTIYRWIEDKGYKDQQEERKAKQASKTEQKQIRINTLKNSLSSLEDSYKEVSRNPTNREYIQNLLGYVEIIMSQIRGL